MPGLRVGYYKGLAILVPMALPYHQRSPLFLLVGESQKSFGLSYKIESSAAGIGLDNLVPVWPETCRHRLPLLCPCRDRSKGF